MSLLLGQIVDALGGELEGAAREKRIARIAPLESAGPGDLSFLSNPRYQQQLAASQAACVIVAPALREQARQRGACIVAANPYAYFARATQLWRQVQGSGPVPGVHPSAVVHPDAQVDASAIIGPLCVVERGARIGAGTWLKSRVTVGEDCQVGARCILHSGVVVGADGFGFAVSPRHWSCCGPTGSPASLRRALEPRRSFPPRALRLALSLSPYRILLFREPRGPMRATPEAARR